MKDSTAGVLSFDAFRASLASRDTPSDIAALRALAFRAAKRMKDGLLFREPWPNWGRDA